MGQCIEESQALSKLESWDSRKLFVLSSPGLWLHCLCLFVQELVPDAQLAKWIALKLLQPTEAASRAQWIYLLVSIQVLNMEKVETGDLENDTGKGEKMNELTSDTKTESQLHQEISVAS